MSIPEKNSSTYSEFSRHILNVLSSENNDVLFENIDETIKDARNVRQEIINKYFERNFECEVDQNTPESFENYTDGRLLKILNNKHDLLLPGMKVDYNLDVKKSVELLTQLTKDINITQTSNDEIILNPIIEVQVDKELDMYNDTLKRLNGRFENLQIDEQLDMTNKRNVDVEDCIRELKSITIGVDKFIAANTNMSRENKNMDNKSTTKVCDDTLIQNIEKCLTETDSLLYAMNCQLNSK